MVLSVLLAMVHEKERERVSERERERKKEREKEKERKRARERERERDVSRMRRVVLSPCLPLLLPLSQLFSFSPLPYSNSSWNPW